MTIFNQSGCVISAYRSYPMLKFVDDVGSTVRFPSKTYRFRDRSGHQKWYSVNEVKTLNWATLGWRLFCFERSSIHPSKIYLKCDPTEQTISSSFSQNEKSISDRNRNFLLRRRASHANENIFLQTSITPFLSLSLLISQSLIWYQPFQVSISEIPGLYLSACLSVQVYVL